MNRKSIRAHKQTNQCSLLDYHHHITHSTERLANLLVNLDEKEATYSYFLFVYGSLLVCVDDCLIGFTWHRYHSNLLKIYFCDLSCLYVFLVYTYALIQTHALFYDLGMSCHVRVQLVTK